MISQAISFFKKYTTIINSAPDSYLKSLIIGLDYVIKGRGEPLSTPSPRKAQMIKQRASKEGNKSERESRGRDKALPYFIFYHSRSSV